MTATSRKRGDRMRVSEPVPLEWTPDALHRDRLHAGGRFMIYQVYGIWYLIDAGVRVSRGTKADVIEQAERRAR